MLLEICCFHLYLFFRFSKHVLVFDVIQGGVGIISVLLRLLRLALRTPNIVLCDEYCMREECVFYCD